MSLVLIVNSIFQEESQDFNEGTSLVGVYENMEDLKKGLQTHFDKEYGSEGYKLDWTHFDDYDCVEIKYDDDDNVGDEMLELGYVII